MAIISINIKEGTLQKEEYIVGIDLGTTNSLVAVAGKDGGAPRTLRGKGNSVIVPSVVHFMKDSGVIVGNDAIPFLVSDPSRTIYSVKRLMGKSARDIQERASKLSYTLLNEDPDSLVRIGVDGRYFTPIELSASILSELKTRAEQELGGAVKKAVITVPAYFNDAQRQATRDAGKLAGLEVLRIVNEPTAASLAYGIGLDKNKSLNVAVYDLGGGTFDISILRISNGIFEVLATNGDTYLGGDDFDAEIIKYLLSKNGISKEPDHSDYQLIRLSAEKMKKELSEKDQSTESILLNGEALNLELTRKEMDEVISPIISRTLKACEKALRDSGLEKNEIDEVVLVGGSTRTLAVREKVKALFPYSEIKSDINPDEVVALGAAIEADILAGNRKDVLLLDVTPLSLGIETLGGLMDVMISRNSKIPVRVGKQYTTSVDGQVNLKINVFQGERDLVSENRKLAEFTLKGIPAMPAGFPKIQVNFILNADGILNVEAEELRSGVKQQVEVKPQYGLTDQDVERMLLESISHAEEDVARRMLIETRTEAQQIIYVTERFLEKNQELLNDNELQRSYLLVNDLKNSLESGNKDIILKQVEELNEYTRPFAERLMDISISKALKGKYIEP